MEYFKPIDKIAKKGKEKIPSMMPKIIMSVACFVAFYVLAIFVYNQIVKYNQENENNKIVLEPLAYFAYYVIICIGISIILVNLGIELNSLFVILGSIGLTLGLALQSTISNIASGVMILLLNYYDIGDLIEFGPTLGYVDKFDLFTTTIKDQNGVFIKVPNATITGAPITNYSKYEDVILAFVVTLSSNNVSEKYDELIREINAKLAAECTYATNKDEISVDVLNLSASGTQLKINVPIKSRDYLAAKYLSQQIVRNVITEKKLLMVDNSYVK
jgi:small conductance mechanosensitive channel